MKKLLYLEWMAKSGNLIRVDEEKRSKPDDSNKRPDAKQKKGKGKVSEGDAAKGKSSKPCKPRYEGKAILTLYHMVS